MRRAFALVWLTCAACAGAPEPPPQPCEASSAVVSDDPVAVAERWARGFGPGKLSALDAATRRDVAGWRHVSVERVWRQHQGYRALVRDEATSDVALLLTIDRDASGIWRVVALERAETTTLWPEI